MLTLASNKLQKTNLYPHLSRALLHEIDFHLLIGIDIKKDVTDSDGAT